VKKISVKDKKSRLIDPETKQEYYETERVGSLTVEFDGDDLGGDEYKEMVSMIGDYAPTLGISMSGGMR
jgi:hypothetical protein